MGNNRYNNGKNDKFRAKGSKRSFYDEKRPQRKQYNDGNGAEEGLENGSVPGRNAVRELLKSGRTIEKIYVQSGEREGSITVLAAEALTRGIPLIEVEKAKLDKMCGYEQHQGIVAIASEKEYVEIEDVLKIAEERGEKPLIVIADNISDPHNLGAIIRCAEGAGAHGVIIPKRRSACITPAVAKASAGATEHMACVKCVNVTETIKKLKDYGLWVYAAEADGEDYTKVDYTVPCAIVVGSEENGVSPLVKKNCDYIVSLPMRGKVNSLNVSTASAVLLYEALRQRGY
ncbi:MAG: 23S rRNA (guanosine(2251)-2'-O)-methyltransferase RlmB [Clostridia bacterium]|nr:23S rRNA (guanosine(2251)-2'-O)-methyltransferase RlmB [Clostridia bacterium]